MKILSAMDIVLYLINDGMKDELFNSSSFFRKNYDLLDQYE